MMCTHLDQSTRIRPRIRYCEECRKSGGTWVHLRICQSCGVTLCCDSSPSKHMSAHSEVAGHLVAASAEPRERWAWCYEDREMDPFYFGENPSQDKK